MGKRLPLGLLLAVALHVTLRALILHTNFDAVALHMYERYPMGTIPVILSEGSSIPLHYFYDNAAGQQVVGLMASLSYAVLEPSYLALKMVPFAFGIGTLVLVWMFLNENFSRRAANVGAFLFALGPTQIVKYSLIASGNHFENAFFTMLALWCFYRMHRLGPSTNRLFATGLCCGLALLVFLGAIIPVGLMAGMHVGLRGLKRSARDLVPGGGGFLLGILPLIWANLSTGGRGTAFLATKFSEEDRVSSGRLVERLREYFLEHVPAASVYEPLGPVSGELLDGLFLILFLAAWIAAGTALVGGLTALTRNVFRGEDGLFDRVKTLPPVLYLPLSGLAFAGSNLKVGGYAPPLEAGSYRYFVPHFVYAIILIAIAAGRENASKGLRIFGTTLAGLALFAGLSNWTLVDFGFERTGLGARYRGYDFHAASKVLVGRVNELERSEMIRLAEEFRPALRGQLYEGIGYHLAFFSTRGQPDPIGIDLDEVLREMPADMHDELMRGAGSYLRWGLNFVPEAARDGFLEQILARFETWQAEGRDVERLVEGFCTSFDFVPEYRVAHHVEQNVVWLGRVPQDLREAMARGHGLQCGRLLRRNNRSEESPILGSATRTPHELLDDFYFGLGVGLADGALLPGLPTAWERIGNETDTLRGFVAGFRNVYREAEREEAWSELESRMSKQLVRRVNEAAGRGPGN